MSKCTKGKCKYCGKEYTFSYNVAPQDDFFWGKPPKGMNCKLKSVLEKGMTSSYEYDFGSTTELMITVVDHRIGNDRKEKLIVAQAIVVPSPLFLHRINQKPVGLFYGNLCGTIGRYGRFHCGKLWSCGIFRYL